MFRRNDPRLQRTLNQLSQNLESANETAQAGLYSFTQAYISPCLDSCGQCLRASTATCFPTREERLRRRGRLRGRAELNFDFYDHWEAEENDGLLGWDNDGLDRLLGSSRTYGATSSQPQRHRTMSYGTRNRRPGVDGQDPTIIPNTSYIGFLGRLPWKLGRRALRYRPSAADLQENPGARRSLEWEGEELLDPEEGHARQSKVPPGRGRSGTAGSTDTADSLSSRGDIFPSEDEDDAVPIDDEFSLALDRRNTNLEESSSGKTGSIKRRPKSTRTPSSKTYKSAQSRKHRGSGLPSPATDISKEAPSMVDLRQEEERVEQEEESGIEKKRDAAKKLAFQRGLGTLHRNESGANDAPSPNVSTPAPVSQVTTPSISSPVVPLPSTSVRSPEPPQQEEPRRPPADETDDQGDSQAEVNRNRTSFNPARLPHFHPD